MLDIDESEYEDYSMHMRNITKLLQGGDGKRCGKKDWQLCWQPDWRR